MNLSIFVVFANYFNQYLVILEFTIHIIMLKKIFLGFVAVAVVLIGYNIYQLATTKSHSPENVARYDSDGINIAISYSQPYKKGRLIFGEGEDALVPYDRVWRTGANEATQITLETDIHLQDSLLKAGTYSLYTIPGKDEWTLAINSKTDYWGRTLVGSPFEESLDILRVKSKPVTIPNEVEQFTINFTEKDSIVNLNLIWDKTKVSFTITN